MALNDEKNIKPYTQNYGAMTPGAFQKKLRTCVIFQFIRFLVINVKMLIVVAKSH